MARFDEWEGSKRETANFLFLSGMQGTAWAVKSRAKRQRSEQKC